MIDMENFSRELYEDFLNTHPALKGDDSELSKFARVMADMAATAIAKYDRETAR